MALTVALPASGSKVGPGYFVSATGAAGPTALDDFLLARIQLVGGGDLAQGSGLFNGATFAAVTIGVFQEAITPLQALTSQVSAGDAVQINLQRYNVGGTLIEQTTTTGFTWDPLNGLSMLLSRLLLEGGASGLAEVLNAVRRTYTSP